MDSLSDMTHRSERMMKIALIENGVEKKTAEKWIKEYIEQKRLKNQRNVYKAP